MTTSTSTHPPESVLLLPGLWMPHHAMRFLGRRLTQAGYRVSYFQYTAVAAHWERNVERLVKSIEQNDSPIVHVVAHSYGGLIAWHALQRVNHKQGKLVCLGSPISKSRTASGLARFAWGRLLLGKSLTLLSDARISSKINRYAAVMIAGTRGVGLGQFFSPMGGTHDGAVALEETELPFLSAHHALPVAHSQMLISQEVANLTVQILRHGS